MNRCIYHCYASMVFFIILFSMRNYAQEAGDLIWKTSTDWHVNAIAPADDSNGDGISDVFAGSSDNLAYCLSGGGINKGSVIWAWNFNADVWTVTRIPDINGDGVDDCLVGCAENVLYCMTGKAENGLTEILWSYPINGDVLSVGVLEDLNNDGIRDCVMGSNDDRVYCIDGAYGHFLWSYLDNKKGAIKSVSRISDVNGDGKDDCLAGGENDKVFCISGASSSMGNVIWYYQAGSTILSVTNIGDVNGDGFEDCLAGGEDNNIYCISGASSGKTSALWTYSTGSTIKTVSSIGDANGDGVPDCLVGGEDDYIYCISGKTGSKVWSYKTQSTVLSVSSIDDVNGDGSEDCIGGGQDDTFYCLDGKTGSVLWSNNVSGTINCVTAISDLNGNGLMDVIGGSNDSYVYAFEGGTGGEQTETVSTPNVPSGPSSGVVGQSMSFNTGGASSNLGHPLEYRFDWGDGQISAWGSSTRNYVYSPVGNYNVRSQARCQTHTDIVSNWSSAKSVSLTGHTLTISVVGLGSVQRDPEKTQYNHNELVTLTAFPATGYKFDHWSGDLVGNSNPGYITMSANISINAHFSESPETVSNPNMPTGPSSGVVGQSMSFNTGGASSNLGHPLEYRFDWGDGQISAWGSSTRNYVYSPVGNYNVRSQARCQTHTAIVSNWSSAKSVSVSGHTLSISVVGSGSVEKSPNKAEYDYQENVILNPSPLSGYQFDHWEGDLTGNDNPGVLTMNSDKTVTAYFVETTETISIPSIPTGPNSGKVGESLSLSTGGATSNLGHNLEYHFNWGDGTISSWGSPTQSHVYVNVGLYQVRAQARCQEHTGVVSGWSSTYGVMITGHSLTITIIGNGSVEKNPDKTEYNHNESVGLAALPSSDYRFDHWEGDLTGNVNPATIDMNSDRNVEVYFSEIVETISSPQTPIGPTSGNVGDLLSYSTVGGSSNLGHDVEYRFDLGDGIYSGWGRSNLVYSWRFAGTYVVRAQARCTEHTSIVSEWSEGLLVSIQTTGVKQIETSEIPSDFQLFQNYPNPFNSETIFEFQLPQSCDVHFEIFNLSGNLVAVLLNEHYPAGNYILQWGGGTLSGDPLVSGLYIYRLQAGHFKSVKRMMYIK